MKPAPRPWILCRPGLSFLALAVCVMTGLVDRLDGDGLEARLALLDDLADAGDGAAGADAGTRMSTLPSVSFQISSAVVWRWISGLAGFSNCCGMNELGIVLQQFLGLVDGAVHALVAGRQHDLGAERLEQPAAFQAHVSGMVTISL